LNFLPRTWCGRAESCSEGATAAAGVRPTHALCRLSDPALVMELHALDDLTFAGKTLSLEERSGLQAAATKLRLDAGLKNVYFWGKMSGSERDYFICFGIGDSTQYPRKSFFFCTSGDFTLQSFPAMTEEFSAKANAVQGPFKGDPTELLGEEDEEEEEEEEDEDEEGEAKPKKIKFSEMHRLAHVVAQIDADTAVVPRGAFIMGATHYIERNTAWGGLSASEAQDMSNYFHFRQATGLMQKSVLERRGMVQSTDFLDSLAEDTPQGVWSLRLSMATNKATLRSLLWPGYFAYVACDSQRYGGAYFGSGQKNMDIAFSV